MYSAKRSAWHCKLFPPRQDHRQGGVTYLLAACYPSPVPCPLPCPTAPRQCSAPRSSVHSHVRTVHPTSSILRPNAPLPMRPPSCLPPESPVTTTAKVAYLNIMSAPAPVPWPFSVLCNSTPHSPPPPPSFRSVPISRLHPTFPFTILSCRRVPRQDHCQGGVPQPHGDLMYHYHHPRSFIQYPAPTLQFIR